MTKYIKRLPLLDKIDLNKHTLIEASAGTGKTYTLEHLVVEIIMRGQITLPQILLLTFTEKAVEELRSRVKKLIVSILAQSESSEIPACTTDYWEIDAQKEEYLRRALSQYDQTNILTIHSFCRQILLKFPIYTKQALSLELFDDDYYLNQAINWVLGEMQNEHHPGHPLLTAAIASTNKSTKEFLEKIKESLKTIFSIHGELHPASFDNSRETPETQLLQVIHDYVKQRLKALKRKNRFLSFDDLLIKVRDTLSSGAFSENFKNEIIDNYPLCIIDEFQDTDSIQWEIFRQLYLQTNNSTLVMVGDPKQAIYSFRGADLRTYCQAKNEIIQLEAQNRGQILHLETNYRSSEQMVEFFNLLFADPGNNFFDEGVTAFSLKCGQSGNQFISAANGKPITPVAIAYLTAEQAANDQRFSAGYNFRGISKGTYQEIYQNWLAFYLKLMLVKPPLLKTTANQRPLRPNDIYLLAEKNSELHTMAVELEKWGIPYNYYKEEGLFSQPEAKDIADLLKAIANPYDGQIRTRALLGPFFAIPVNDIARYQELSPNHPIMVQLNMWQQMADQKRFTELFSSIMSASGLNCRLLYLLDNLRSLHSYQRILDILTDTAAAGTYELSEIIDILYQYMENIRPTPKTDLNKHQQQFSHPGVELLTMHKSKGLEAPVVAICGGFSGTTPADAFTVSLFYQNEQRYLYIGSPKEPYTSLINENKRSEQQRLMYVALTRASYHLIIPAWYGKTFNDHLDKSALAQINGQLHILYGQTPPIKKPNLARFYNLLTESSLTSPDKTLIDKPIVHPNEENIGPDSNQENLLHSPKQEIEFLTLSAEKWRGPMISSYSRIKKYEGHDYSLQAIEDQEMTNIDNNIENLPGGTTFGTMVHTLFKEIDLSTIIPGQDYQEWLAQAEINRLFIKECLLYDFDQSLIKPLARQIYQVLSQPLAITPTFSLPPIYTCQYEEREMEFFFPVPDSESRPLTNMESFAEVKNGYIKGYLDMFLTFDQQKFYIIDWKSDALPAYDQKSLASHVNKNYDIQARLYSLTLAKMLNLSSEEEYQQRFGGMLYIFVRAAEIGGGCYQYCPDWVTLQKDYQNLAHQTLGVINEQ